MCSHSASVETDLSFTHSNSHSTSQHTRNFVYTNLIKQQIQLFCCSVSVVYSISVTNLDKIISLSNTHTPSTLFLSTFL